MKTAIVTGASKGVGRETSILLSNSGYRVIAISRNIDALKEIESENIEIYQLDLTEYNSIDKFYSKYKEITLDLLVNNAGGGASPSIIINENPKNFNYSFSLNVGGPMYLSKLFAKNMQKSSNPSIIFISSLGGKFPYRGGGNYTNAKRAVSGLVETMRLEYPVYGIKVTEIIPGSIDTVDGETRKIALKARDLAETILWVSNLPSYVNINYIEMNHIFSDRY